MVVDEDFFGFRLFLECQDLAYNHDVTARRKYHHNSDPKQQVRPDKNSNRRRNDTKHNTRHQSAQDTHYSPGNKSAIDIWAIKNDALYLFELKKPGNKPLGIISEIMYYTNVVNDLLSHRINYERLEESTNIKKAVQKNYRNFKVFYEAYMNGSIRSINSILLAREIHPLITEGLLDFVNESPRWKYLNIRFSSRTL